MDIYTIDFETFYDRDFSLSKMTTERYVRDPRFEAILLGVKKNNGPVKWIPKPLIEPFLKAVDFSKSAILCHNTAFDGAILSWHYGVKPKLWLDTLSMARPLHSVTVGGSLKALAQYYKLGVKGDEVVNALGKRYADFSRQELERYAEYCVNDVELTYQLWLRLKKELPPSELLVIDQTLRMYTQPMIELDVPLLEKHLGEVRQRKEDILAELASAMGMDAKVDTLALKPILMSNNNLALMLRGLGVEPPTKISARTGKETYAFGKTDKGFTDLLEHPDERVRAAVEARLGTKSTLEETRTEAFIGIAGRGPLPIMLNYYGAHTGRFSGGDKVNLQNLPSRGNTTIRQALKAPEGYEIIACDSSQIEARTVAWLAGQNDLVEAFAEGRDVYCEFASDVYGRIITKADTKERFVGKTGILSLGYGAGAAKFREMLRIQAGITIDEHEAERIVRLYRQKYWKIVQLWQTCNQILKDMAGNRNGTLKGVITYDGDGIMLPNKLRITYPALRQTKDGFQYINDARTYRKAIKDRVTGGNLDDLPWVKIYGGKCLSADTEVLTERGWVAITEVSTNDRVWDGVEWVNHNGLTFQGYKNTIIVDGVRMTPDHKVLTDKGWRCASSCEGLHRTDFRIPDGYGIRRVEREQVDVDIYMSVREASHQSSNGRNKVCTSRRNPVMWMPYGGQDQDPRYEQAPGLLGMAVYARQVQATFASSVAQLRRSWDTCVREVGGFVRSVLGGYGSIVQAGADLGSQGQQRTLLAGELPVGGLHYAGREQAQSITHRHLESTRSDGYFSVNPELSVEAEPVYDILNAGPRSRFVVRGNEGPFIVHNCVENIVQALAGIIVRWQMALIGQAGHFVAFQVHDENVCVVPAVSGEAAEAEIVRIMSTPPAWAPDLPVACESGRADNYGEC